MHLPRLSLFNGLADVVKGKAMSFARRIVLGAAIVLFGIWMATHWGRLTGDPDALIRFTLGALFAVAIILRRKESERLPFRLPRWIVPIVLGCGVVLAMGGIIFKVHIAEWIGILLLLFACSVWVAPKHFGPDLVLAFFVLFWMHPLPGQVFGWLQGGMQRLSVIGAEIVLHAANVRVWGDGIVLRTGYQVFLVPEACSGMRTAVTVFLCTIGVGILLRLKWYETISFVALGLAQVLALNIARISYMVIWAPRMPPEWASTFLHDSLAIFLMGAILLVQLEASWWCWWSRRRKRIKAGIRNRELEPPDKASVVPHALRRLGPILLGLAAAGAIVLGIAGVVFKSRAYHRKEMVREVALGLIETDPVSAHRAIRAALALAPGDTDLLAMRVRTDFVRGRFAEGLATLDAREADGEELSLQETVLKSWALMRIGRQDEAKVIVDALPPETDRLTGVAMLRAEFSALEDRPEDAARYVVLASRSHRMLPRIRTLFPYLAMHEQWSAIADSDHDEPYTELFQALIAIYANQKIGDLSGVARVLAHAIQAWPDDSRFLPDLFRLAQQRKGSEWESRFERNLMANAARLSPDRLAVAQDFCWRLSRPDLAWIVFRQLERRDPVDPALLMAPAQYGGQWCLFRRHQVNVEAEDAAARVNLLPVINAFASCSPFDAFSQRIPLRDEIEAASEPTARKVYLKQSFDELVKREEAGPLSSRLSRLYPIVLAMLDRYDEAHERLDEMFESHPEQKADILFQHAVFYDQEGKWQDSYEALKQRDAMADIPNLMANLLMTKALMNMNMGVCAMDLVAESRRSFPGALRLDLAEAAIWDVFGFKEQALAVISRAERGSNSPASVGLLYDTGRKNAAFTLSEALGVPLPSHEIHQQLRPPRAEWSVARRWPPPLDAEERGKRIAALEAVGEKATSPFIKGMLALELEWQRSARGSASQPSALAQWEEIGRDDRERVAALYQLAMLAARESDYELATAAVARCLELIPDSPVLWRVYIALTEGDADTVDTAQSRCPHDPEIWLASLVTRTGSLTDVSAGSANIARSTSPGSPSWSTITNMVSTAIEKNVFAPGTLVRAGDFLLSRRQPALAAALARQAIPQARGLLSAHVLGLRTALVQGNARWAETCAMNGVENAQDPTPFYKTLVDIKSARRHVDNDLLVALEYLQDQADAEPRWAETLGRVYFQKGDMRRALSIFGSVMEGDTKGVSIQTLILAAEAARRDAKVDRAVRILEAAYAMQPERMSVLNNLVYLLAQNPQTLSRAQALMPKLLEIGSESFAVMDTAAIVYLRSGDIESAKLWMDKATAALKEDSYSANEVKLNAAELQMRRGEYDAARVSVQALRQDATRTDFIDQKARGLLRDINSLSQ